MVEDDLVCLTEEVYGTDIKPGQVGLVTEVFPAAVVKGVDLGYAVAVKFTDINTGEQLDHLLLHSSRLFVI